MTITTCADLLDSTFAGLLPGKFLRALNDNGYFGGLASVTQVDKEITLRQKGKLTFQNVTRELLAITFVIEVEMTDGKIEVVYRFLTFKAFL